MDVLRETFPGYTYLNSSNVRQNLSEIFIPVSCEITCTSKPSNLLTLYKAQIRRLEYCSHIWGAAAPTTLSLLDAVQRRAIRLIGDPALTCHLQPLSHRRAVGDLSLFYRYSNGFCSSELTSIIPPLSKPARCTRGTSSSHPKAVVLHTSRTE
nr:unnamed protein product [Callosobruchus chinensis]